MIDAGQRVDLPAECAQGLAGRWLNTGVRALADDDLFIFVNENDIRCQSGLCG